MRRRTMLALTGSAALFAAGRAAAAGDAVYEITRSDDDWRRRLTPDQFAVLRRGATERPFSSPLDREARPGVYDCAGCALPLFDAAAKFDSGTGWPSFTSARDGAVGLDRGVSYYLGFGEEVRCRRCGGHLGHLFEDGPAPTGLRYCMNGAALTFRPDAAAS